MALNYTGTTIGRIVIKQNDELFTLQIRQGNCLAIIIHVTGTTHTLYTFFVDEQHMKNIIKGQGKLLGDEVEQIELNMFYKENYKLLKYFVLSGYMVNCYYEDYKGDK